ncbi:hypothetical protein BASA62_007757 [Batrachochytrium salamandrivorans]|nr:hypothetical protein BASA62_007757 [Batrachochytrium salamandrivorans]
MSFREMKTFTEKMRGLGYPKPISMESFRTPNFDLMADILFWLVKSYDSSIDISNNVSSEQDRIIFIKTISAFMAPKAHVLLNTRKLYMADGYAVKELLKIANLLCKAHTLRHENDEHSSLHHLDITNKISYLKTSRTLASEITEKGAELYDLLGQEIGLRDRRSDVISKPFELSEMERTVAEAVNQLQEQISSTRTGMESLLSDETNLVSKIEKKKLELDRAEKRLKSLSSVRPAYMDEYEKIEVDLSKLYNTYMEKFRNLAFLEQQLDEYNREEQDKFDETELSLKRMQSRLREDELRLLRGEKEMGKERPAAKNDGRLHRPTAASRSRGIDLNDNPSNSDVDDSSQTSGSNSPQNAEEDGLSIDTGASDSEIDKDDEEDERLDSTQGTNRGFGFNGDGGDVSRRARSTRPRRAGENPLSMTNRPVSRSGGMRPSAERPIAGRTTEVPSYSSPDIGINGGLQMEYQSHLVNAHKPKMGRHGRSRQDSGRDTEDRSNEDTDEDTGDGFSESDMDDEERIEFDDDDGMDSSSEGAVIRNAGAGTAPVGATTTTTAAEMQQEEMSEEKHQEEQQQEQQYAQQPLPQAPQAVAKNIIVTALYDYEAQGENELSLHEGDVIQVLTRLPSGWWNGMCSGKQGWFPFNFVSTPVIVPVPNPDQQDILDPSPSESTLLATANAQLLQSQLQHRSMLSRTSSYTSHSGESTFSSASNYLARKQSVRSPTNTGQSQAISLPPNWGIKATSDGRIYYYNLNTDETRWTLTEVDSEGPIANVSESASNSTALIGEEQLDTTTAIEWTWPGLTNQIIVHIHLLATAIKSTRKDKYVPATSAIVDSIRIMLYASGTPKRDSSILASNKTLKMYHRQILSSLSKLVLASKTASGVWPPPDAAAVLTQVNNEVLVAVRCFSVEASESNIPIFQIDAPSLTTMDTHADPNQSKNGHENPEQRTGNADDESEPNAPPTSAELLNFLETSLKRTTHLVAKLADPVQVRSLRIKSPEPEDAAERNVASISHTSLFSIVRSILKEVGNFFELIDDLPLDSLSNDLTVDFKVNRLALTNAISGLVTSTGHVTNALLVSNAMQDISAAARLVEKSVKELLISTKFLIEEKESVEQMTLQTYIDQHNQVNRPTSDEQYSRHCRSMSMTYSQAQNIPGATAQGLNSKQNDTDLHSVPTRGLSVGGGMGDRSESGPLSAGSIRTGALMADSDIFNELDDPAFSVGGRRTSKLRKLLGEDAPPIIKPKPDMPWYLQYDYGPNDIILNMENNIRGGTLKALVEKLTLHDSVDANFVQCFLITYKSFTNSVELVGLLEQRFLMPRPEGLTHTELAEWKDKKLTPVRLRVFNVLKSWFENYLGHEPQDLQALVLVRDFAEFRMAEFMDAASSQLIRIIDRRLSNGPSVPAGRLVAVAANRDYPQPILPRNLRKFRFLDLDPLEVARQLTIKEGDIFACIQLSEFLNKAWSCKGRPDLGINVNRMSSLSNQIIAWKCFSLNNYSSLMNIIGTLDSAHVHRLKKTWELVPSRQISTYESLRDIMSPHRNFSNYRNALHSVNPPAVPFVGCYLTDLTFIADGNPDTLKGRDNIINFAKMSKTAETLRDIQQFQHIKYALHKVPEIQDFLDSVLVEDATETEFYEMSLKVEPRNISAKESEEIRLNALLHDSGLVNLG